MKPGTELDGLVCEVVLGWERITAYPAAWEKLRGAPGLARLYDGPWWRPVELTFDELPCNGVAPREVSTDDGDFVRHVVEAAFAKGFTYETGRSMHGWVARFDRDGIGSIAFGKTLAEAGCFAVLLAYGRDVEQDGDERMKARHHAAD